MFVVTLISSPQSVGLEPVLLETLRGAWGGGETRWLAPGEAAEFHIPACPENQWDTWESLQLLGVDLIVQPAAGRRKPMFLADMDSTMIQQECIDELAAEIGVGDAVAGITARAMNGELGFEASLVERVLMLKGASSDVIETVLINRITLTPGGETLLKTMKSNGTYCALVSGGFTAFSSVVASNLGFDEHRANTLIVKNGVLSGAVEFPILGREAKVTALSEISSRLGLESAQVMAVGDGANDLGMLHMAGSGVALHAKPSVAEQCDIRINHGDLTSLLYLQGYRQSEFVL